jgi:hypothetical protein
VIGEDVPVAVTGEPELDVAVTVYPVTAYSPVLVGAEKLTVASSFPVMTDNTVGGPGVPAATVKVSIPLPSARPLVASSVTM